MGDMADYYAEMAASIPDWMYDDYPTGYGPKNRFDDFRSDLWEMKDGTQIEIKRMSFKHLLNAYKMFGDERFRDEMLIRMFEDKLNEKNKFIW